MTDLSARQLRRAADIKDKIESLQTELNRLLGSTNGTAAARKRRKMSALARARIAAAQKARWAKRRGVKSSKAAAKPRRKMSAAARKRLAQLAKARWAKAKAAGRKTL
jgi:ABC-type Fe3+-citrate transport system substrate-binding protein